MFVTTFNLNILPVEDPIELDTKTLDSNIKCKPDYAMALIFSPFPGLELTRYAIEKGYLDSKPELNHHVNYMVSSLKFDDKLKKELEKLRAAEEVLKELGEIATQLPIEKPRGTLVEAVMQALSELGPATSGEVIAWLRQNWSSAVNTNSARSTLSGYKDKFRSKGGKWHLVERRLRL